jgi:hypothetical protein
MAVSFVDELEELFVVVNVDVVAVDDDDDDAMIL